MGTCFACALRVGYSVRYSQAFGWQSPLKDGNRDSKYVMVLVTSLYTF